MRYFNLSWSPNRAGREVRRRRAHVTGRKQRNAHEATSRLIISLTLLLPMDQRLPTQPRQRTTPNCRLQRERERTGTGNGDGDGCSGWQPRPPRWRPGGCGAGAIHLFVPGCACLAGCLPFQETGAPGPYKSSPLPSPGLRRARRSRRGATRFRRLIGRSCQAACSSCRVSSSTGLRVPQVSLLLIVTLMLLPPAVSQLSSVLFLALRSYLVAGLWFLWGSWVCLPWVHTDELANCAWLVPEFPCPSFNS